MKNVYFVAMLGVNESGQPMLSAGVSFESANDAHSIVNNKLSNEGYDYVTHVTQIVEVGQ